MAVDEDNGERVSGSQCVVPVDVEVWLTGARLLIRNILWSGEKWEPGQYLDEGNARHEPDMEAGVE